MTLTVGGSKASRLTIGGNTFVNVEDVWLPCEVGEGFTGIPILMHYDPDTKITSFIGQSTITVNKSDFPWTHDLLELPLGFHFTEVDTDIPIFFAGTKQNALQFPLSVESRTLSIKFSRWPWAIDLAFFLANMSFGYITPNISSAGARVWQTKTVAPD